MDAMKEAEIVARKSRQGLYELGAISAAAFVAGVVLQAWWPNYGREEVPLRLVALVVFTLFALKRRSLTVWIIWGMFAGVELGLDLPHIALQARVFSDIFLRLIKAIVAPLILGTLITG